MADNAWIKTLTDHLQAASAEYERLKQTYTQAHAAYNTWLIGPPLQTNADAILPRKQVVDGAARARDGAQTKVGLLTSLLKLETTGKLDGGE